MLARIVELSNLCLYVLLYRADAAEAIKMIDFGTHLGTTIDDMDVIFNVRFS